MPSWMQADKLTAEQRANVAVIIAVGRRLGASDRDITIALMTAAQESEFRNISYGDTAGPDSRGLFQQRAPWGTLAQRMDPVAATTMFFLGGHDGQRGLFDFKNRDQLSLTRAAQAVQVSAYPDAYAKHEELARTLLGSHTPDQPVSTPAPVAPVTPTPQAPPALDPMAKYDDQQDTSLAPGAGAANSPGAEAATAPGAQAATEASPQRDALAEPIPTPAATTSIPTMDFDTFRATFPDAADNRTFSGASNASEGRRSDTITGAMSYIGTPYAWGGNDRSGLDCSGLVQQVYAGMGIDLPRLSADQLRAGQRTDYAHLAAGDLIGWQHGNRNGSGVEHIAIYAGDGYIIEAPRPGIPVRRRKLSAAEIASAEGAHFAQLD